MRKKNTREGNVKGKFKAVKKMRKRKKIKKTVIKGGRCFRQKQKQRRRKSERR